MHEQPALPAIEYAARSDPGRDPEKQVNEDACGRRETRLGHLVVVCDGMGGHAAGREAAELALSTIFEVVANAPDGATPGQALRAGIEEASRRVHVMHTSEVGQGRPGSTCVALLMHAGGTEVAHVGDSRAYHVHAGQIFRVTRDHSVVQEMVDRGLLTPQQAASHPDANRITRALGMAPEVEVELRPQPVHHVTGDAFLLCSDGLSDLVQDDDILAVVGAEPAAQAVGKLVDLANARGGHDNVTVVVVRARETALAPSAPVPPTVAQTPTLAPDTMPTVAASAPTLIEARGERLTQPVVPLGAGAPAPAPPAAPPVAGPVAPPAAPPVPAPMAQVRPFETPPPPSTSHLTRRRGSPVVAVGVVLALVAAALFGWVVVEYMEERKGKHTTTGPAGLLLFDGGEPTAPSVALSASALPTTTASSVPPAPPIAPLETAPSRKRRMP